MMPKAALSKQLFFKIEIKQICFTESTWLILTTELPFSKAKKDMLKSIITILFLFMIKKAMKTNLHKGVQGEQNMKVNYYAVIIQYFHILHH